jgi:hypothetical protein
MPEAIGLLPDMKVAATTEVIGNADVMTAMTIETVIAGN